MGNTSDKASKSETKFMSAIIFDDLDEKVRASTIYRFVEEYEKSTGLTAEESYNEIVSLLNLLCNNFPVFSSFSLYLSDSEKIRLILDSLGRTIDVATLNKMLKEEIDKEEQLTKEQALFWNIIFDQDYFDTGEINKEFLTRSLLVPYQYRSSEIEREIGYLREDTERETEERDRANHGEIEEAMGPGRETREEREEGRGNYKETGNPERKSAGERLREEEKKLVELKISLARLNGYDLDRDHDGVRGIDMTTGNVIDFEDARIADNTNLAYDIDDVEMVERERTGGQGV